VDLNQYPDFQRNDYSLGPRSTPAQTFSPVVLQYISDIDDCLEDTREDY